MDKVELTFRFFIQENESISFRSLANLVTDPDLSETWKNGFTQARNHLNQFYDRPSFLQINNKRLSHRDIMMTVIYGGLAHGNNPTRRQAYEEWKSDPLASTFAQQIFLTTLIQTLNVITYICELSKKELGIN